MWRPASRKLGFPRSEKPYCEERSDAASPIEYHVEIEKPLTRRCPSASTFPNVKAWHVYDLKKLFSKI